VPIIQVALGHEVLLRHHHHQQQEQQHEQEDQRPERLVVVRHSQLKNTDCNMNSLLGLSLCFFLVLVAESLSFKPPVRAWHHPVGHRMMLPQATVGERHSSLFLLRGGDAEGKEGGIKAAFDPSLIAGALVAMGKFYSSSLESSPVLTKSVTVRIVKIKEEALRSAGLPLLCSRNLLLYLGTFLLVDIHYLIRTTQGHGAICYFGPDGAGIGDSATTQQVRVI
jgi:hypothetical protein